MGCICSKRASSSSPSYDEIREIQVKRSKPLNYDDHIIDKSSHQADNVQHNPEDKKDTFELCDHEEENEVENKKSRKKFKSSKSKNSSLNLNFGSVKSQVVAEQAAAAAGWPNWLTAVAGEAIHGWVPLRADGFEKLEKIGQGTYSSVFRAREHATGKIVALKKVRFDNYHPESVRFMAREITILRKLDHPNIMKLHGLIASHVSCSIYLVFDYMEHDLAGLLSSPQVTFTEAQIKCFMQQILYALDYCHQRGVMHRDIKTSNILLNNEGVVKLADFGLANFISARYKQPLTSRVVTLWYRPPELLLGSTNYGAYVDMWSLGCVFAELLIGKALLKGKTEVEQLHKIFKLCGSPQEEYWEKSKLPHATMFKPQAPYESSLRERFKSLPEHTVTLLETLLSVEPQNRGTAASTLNSTYFTTMPYACDPSSLPKYPPNKEIDAKLREESRRTRTSRIQDSTTSSRKQRRNRKGLEPTSVSMLGRPGLEEPQVNRKYARRNGTNALVTQIRRGDDEISLDMKSDVSQVTNASQGDMLFGGDRKRAALAMAKRRIANERLSTLKMMKNNNNIDASGHVNKMLDVQPEEVEELQAEDSSEKPATKHESQDRTNNSIDMSSSEFSDHKDRTSSELQRKEI